MLAHLTEDHARCRDAGACRRFLQRRIAGLMFPGETLKVRISNDDGRPLAHTAPSRDDAVMRAPKWSWRRAGRNHVTIAAAARFPRLRPRCAKPSRRVRL